MSGNFLFLEEKYPLLKKIGGLAEGYLYSDPNSCMTKLGQFTETLVKYLRELNDLPVLKSQIENIDGLYSQGLISQEIRKTLNELRKKRNQAVHEYNEETCGALLRKTYDLSVWFMQTYADKAYVPADFKLPEDLGDQAVSQKQILEDEKQVKKFRKLPAADALQQIQNSAQKPKRKTTSRRTSRRVESTAREIIHPADDGSSKIFIVKTTVNQEKSVAKSMALVAKKEHLDVRSILAPEEIKGYVFVEAPGSGIIATLIQAVAHAKMLLPSPSTLGEVEHFLKPKPISAGVTEGSIIEITSGPFKGEKAKVKRIGATQHDEITVELFDAVVPIPITIRGDTVRVLKKEEE